MTKTIAKSLLFTIAVLAGLYSPAAGQEVPRVIHFSRQLYGAQNQNWSITQRPDLQLFFGNSGGLLRFDGSHWQNYPSPSGQIVRTVACDSLGNIFTGGYAALGLWAAGKTGRLEYHSLTGSLEGKGLGNEEIWHILPLADRVIFQSFSTLFIYDYKKVKPLIPPGNIMFARQVNGRVIVPVIDQGLFELLEDGSFQKIPESEIFNNLRIATLLPGNENEMLVCTQESGIFVFKDNKFSLWHSPVNQAIQPAQLNKALRLRNGHFAFGTILNGVFITDAEGRILYHINQENGLQNNTVLALFEDQAEGLWLGLDKGIDLVLPGSPLRFFQDKTGEIGSVYAAALFGGKLYVGSNQGVFYRKYPSKSREAFHLLEGSQGQVWDLQVIEDQLIGGHNSGSFAIRNGRMKFLYSVTGVYTTIPLPGRKDVLLQGTYTGIIVLKKDRQGLWYPANGLEGFYESSKKLFFDKTGRLWVVHPRKGLFRLTLDEELKRPLKIERPDENNKLLSSFRPQVEQIAGEVIAKSDSLFFAWSDSLQRFLPKISLGRERLSPGNFVLIAGRQGEWFKAFPSVLFFFHPQKSILRLSLLMGDEKIIPLADSSYLFCLDDGYAMLPPESGTSHAGHASPPAPLITSIGIEKKGELLDDLRLLPQPCEFNSEDNQLKFYFSCPVFDFQAAVRFRLLGFDEKWSSFQALGNKEFTNLPPGEYEFQVQSELSPAVRSFRFSIRPKWFQMTWARALFVLLLLLVAHLLLKWHQRRLAAQERRLQLEKERELEQQRTLTRNEMLQAEILSKSRKLADSTMNLVRKNEILIKIKNELGASIRGKPGEAPGRSLFKLQRLIDEHLSDDEDWQAFEANFNQLHHQFFTRLKTEFPELTPGDLRLAAYLKMNLSSKEIAPLLNISLRGVENKRYRLRQKMNLHPEVNLTEFLMGY